MEESAGAATGETPDNKPIVICAAYRGKNMNRDREKEILIPKYTGICPNMHSLQSSVQSAVVQTLTSYRSSLNIA